ncbi:MAG: hypothetical protein EXR51_03120 [Dehalococcoidia bacterium]|nr:hypothetical protein [Dehalococcoidia bacterium]
MRSRVFYAFGRQFVALSGEGDSARAPGEATAALLERMAGELNGLGLSLDNTVRTRLWGRTREDRDGGSSERVKRLSGLARSASSSYISPAHFDSDAGIALDLIALRPSQPGLEKRIVEYDPPVVPLRYLVHDSFMVLSGVTAVLPSLGEQVSEILGLIEGSLKHAGLSWDQVIEVGVCLHRSQSLKRLESLLRPRLPFDTARIGFSFADGYSTPGKLVEIEVTAQF